MRVSASRTARLSHEGRFLACAPDRSRIVVAASDGRYTVLDGALRVGHEAKLPVAAGSIALHPSAELLAIASEAELVVAELSGRIVHRHPHRRWNEWEGGAVEFLGDGSRLLAVCPAGEAAVALLLDLRSGEVLAEQAVDAPEPSGFHLIRPPLDGRFALWAGAGQDGQWTYWLRVEGDRISMEEVDALSGKEHGPVAFHASGRELLVEADGGLERYGLPGMRLLGRMEPPDGDFSFSETCCWVGPKRALVTDASTSRLHVVELGAMALEDEVSIEGHEPRPASELYPASGSDDTLCTDLWYLRGLPRAAALSVHGPPGAPQAIVLLEGPPLFDSEP